MAKGDTSKAGGSSPAKARKPTAVQLRKTVAAQAERIAQLEAQCEGLATSLQAAQSALSAMSDALRGDPEARPAKRGTIPDYMRRAGR